MKILREMILAATSQPRPLDKPQAGPEAEFFAQPLLVSTQFINQCTAVGDKTKYFIAFYVK